MHTIKFYRQSDGMLMQAKVSLDISKQYLKHYQLFMRLQAKAIANEADGELFNALEEEIIKAIDERKVEELGKTKERLDGITTLCI